MSESILQKWYITIEELTDIVDQNPSLRGMILGYLAEMKLEKMWLQRTDVSGISKHDDHDRRKKGDRVVMYKGKQFVFEAKSLQTNTIRRADGGWVGKAQVDASDQKRGHSSQRNDSEHYLSASWRVRYFGRKRFRV